MSRADEKWFLGLAGRTIEGKYTLAKYIGRGKVGYVYMAASVVVPSWTVAIKLIPGTLRTGWENELCKVSQLSTIPGVVHLHDMGTCLFEHDGTPEQITFTIWDYIAPGRNLAEYLEGVTTVPVSFLEAVVDQVLRVLHACERRGVAHHGDLHAGNILIGDPDDADVDANLKPRAPIYIADFGYGATGGAREPKDDYAGLADIVNAVSARIDFSKATPQDRRRLLRLREVLQKALSEGQRTERPDPLEVLRATKSVGVTSAQARTETYASEGDVGEVPRSTGLRMRVGRFQISEMLGEDWESWKRLFVSTVPARSRILTLDTPVVVTGPRGCGKTMLFRRLSERLAVECGPVENLPDATEFMGLYINGNDIAAAFPGYPDSPSQGDGAQLICYANLCLLSDFLTVQSARTVRLGEPPHPMLLAAIAEVLHTDSRMLHAGEDALESWRDRLEEVKWTFPTGIRVGFPGASDLGRIEWLPRFLGRMRVACNWLGSRRVFVFMDDYTTPRVTVAMQRVLNRMFFQRSPEFITKIATEAATTFIPEDASSKVLQDGDDYLLIDMAEESLFLQEEERCEFLEKVIDRRLSTDTRIVGGGASLNVVLGCLGCGKTEFARRLRGSKTEAAAKPGRSLVPGPLRRKGAASSKALYHGADVFTALWSGDTRTMIQVIDEVISEAAAPSGHVEPLPVHAELQDRVFRNRGGQWLETQRRDLPTDADAVEAAMARIRELDADFKLTGGSYGAHLKAVAEAFVAAARRLLLGPVYRIPGRSTVREVPRMAFRLEVTDTFRLDGLAREMYNDLIRYGIFMRDARGKSVRGAMVPRLYLRRLLLPYCTLALSKRDSVSMSCKAFTELLTYPDRFLAELQRRKVEQLDLPLLDPKYDDTPGEEQ